MKKYISFLLIAVLFAACTPNNEVGTPFKAGQEITLTAHMPNAGANQLPGKQRISGKDAGTHIDLTWDEGDKVLVKVGDKSAIFTLSSGEGSAQATFTGTMPADGSSFSVQYPIAEPDLSVQTYVENGFGKGLMKMVADNGTLDDGFVLKTEHALLGLQLTGSAALGQIVLTNLADNKTYTLDCMGVTLTDEATLFYLVVPEGEWANGSKIDIYADDNTTIIKTLTKASSVIFSGAMIVSGQDIAADTYQGIGVFSVGDGKTVTFSPGNLQYHLKNDEWRFAESQLDYISEEDNERVNPDYYPYVGWIDLFGWSGSDGSAKFGVSSSVNESDSAGTFVDWGKNQIGNDAPDTWRTLTDDEWFYLRYRRTNAEDLLGVAAVNRRRGLILLPDNWTCPAGVRFHSGFSSCTNGPYDYEGHQTFTADQWSKLEAAGAVFLPAAGRREGSWVSAVWHDGSYWATEYNSNRTHVLNIYADCVGLDNDLNWRSCAKSVRLVKDL